MDKLRVLLVDDEPDLRELVVLVLVEIAGFEVVEAASGPDALRLGADANATVVLLDANMPGWDGPTTMLRLRDTAWGRDLPVVFMTASAEPADVARYRALGAKGVIPKPFDPETLADQLVSVLSG